MKKCTILAMLIALVSSFSVQANEIVINRMHIWKNGVATSYLVEADLDSITFSQEIIQDDETNLPEVADPGAGKTTVVLYVPEETPAGCYAVGPINGWNVQNTQFMFSAVETATNPRWVAYTFDWTEDLTIKVLAIPSDPTVALSWNFQWAKNRDPENDLTEDNVVILQGEGMFELENQGQPQLVGLADGGVCYIHVKAWANSPVIKYLPCETAAFKHPWVGGEWVYREAIKTAEATFELNARYGNTGFCVATDVNGSGENWYPESDIAFVGDVAEGDSVNVKFVSEKGTVGELTVTLIEKAGSQDQPEAEGIGVFSVGEGKTVTFSPGNLQYHPANNVWQFAESQTDYIGDDNANISADYNGWLDLFGWSTSTNDFGVSTSTSNSDYSGFFVDWGTNQIGSDAPNTWRTLTDDEWNYLLNNRNNASSLMGVAQVNGVNGLILLPDNWTCPAGITFKSGFHSSYGTEYYAAYQTFTADQWSKLEKSGAVFLPASGYRWGAAVLNVGDRGRYWSSTEDDEYYARSVGFNSDFLSPQGLSSRYDGFSVRLVKDVEGETTEPGTPPANTENGHEYVDLGLSVKWATCNVGASKPEEYGDHFAWGETTTKSIYTWNTYKYCNGSSTTLTKYNTSSSYGSVNNKTTLELVDDAARANWGGSWRMPTKAEQDELREQCTWTWTTQNGVNGCKVTSKSNGNSIFLPAAGYRGGISLISSRSDGYYWSSSLNANYPYGAYGLGFNSGSVGWYSGDRYYGLSVRPVCP